MEEMPMNNESFDKEVDDFFKNYHDRGMKKWAGFFLSDHTVQINKSNIARNTVYHKKPEMSQYEISKVLLKAFSNHNSVEIQLKNLDEDGKLSADIKGFVEGYDVQTKIIVSGYPISLDSINNIKIQEH